VVVIEGLMNPSYAYDAYDGSILYSGSLLLKPVSSGLEMLVHNVARRCAPYLSTSTAMLVTPAF
jgi:hypothetical protein